MRNKLSLSRNILSTAVRPVGEVLSISQIKVSLTKVREASRGFIRERPLALGENAGFRVVNGFLLCSFPTSLRCCTQSHTVVL